MQSDEPVVEISEGPGSRSGFASLNAAQARPSLVAHKVRGMELQAAKPQKKGNSRGPAYAYNVKDLRNQEMRIAEQAQKSYEHFIEAWRPRSPKEKARGRLNPTRLE